MPGTNLTRDEAATRAALLSVTSYAVELDLTGGEATFGSTTTLVFSCVEPGASTFADLVDATVHEITLNGEAVDVSAYADGRIALTGLAAENTLVVRADCRYSRTGEGLHRFVDPVDDRVYLYSQFEVPDARRVYATFEQPDLKAPYTFTVTAPPRWTVVSNAETPEPEPVTGRDDAAVWCFAATRPMSTYITALVAGEYHGEHRTYAGAHGDIPMGVYCRQSLVAHLDAGAIFEITEQGFAYYEEKFAYPYPFGKYDQLFVPEYNMGAMENAGCVTFRDEYLPRSRQDRSFYEFRAEVILHEMAHMWFGDLVTMRWWDDLWLNESFAEWACHHVAAEVTEFTEAWTGFTNARKNWAYRQDQLPSTHPIAADNVDLRAVEVNFDGITYAKGASVLKQLVAWVGLDPFLEGLRGYFANHAFANAEFSDLLVALEKSSGRELESWAHEWLQTAGVNTLEPDFELDADGSYTAFAVCQTAAADYPTLRRHRLGIGLYDVVEQADGAARLVRRSVLETDIEGALTEITELVGQHQPDLLLLNEGDLAYAKVRLDARSLATVVAGIGTLEDSLARALLWGVAWDMTRDGEMAASDFVTLVLSGLATESDPTAVNRLPNNATTAARLYSDPARRDQLLATWESGLRDLLVGAAPGSDSQLSFTRAYAAVAHTEHAVADLDGLLDGSFVLDGLAVDADLRWTLLKGLSRIGHADADRIAAELDRDRTISGQERAAAVRALRPTAEAKAEAWHDAVVSDEVPNETQRSVSGAFGAYGQHDVLAPYLEKYLEAADTIWEDKGTQRGSTVLEYMFPIYLASPELIERVDQWLATSPANPAAKRLVGEGRDDAARALRAQHRDAQTTPDRSS